MADVALSAGVFALALTQAPRFDPGWQGAVLVGAAVVCGALAMRRRWPVPALTLATAAGVLAIPLHLHVPAGVAILLSAYTVGAATTRRTVLVSATLASSVLLAGGTLLSPDSWAGPNAPVTLVAAALVGTAVGDAVRSRGELVTLLRERARRAEEAVEEETRRRVAEERLRIAREVHDLVAQNIAVINVQAGVAAHHLPDRPEAAEAALGHVRSATRTVLEEFKALLGVLRGSGEPAQHAPTEPAPNLARVEELLDSLTAAGLRIQRSVTGTPRPLPATADLVAYRIVQESLTNARKHGHGQARLALTYTPDGLEIEIGNEYPTTAPQTEEATGTGHGLLGMRERVAAVGGQLEAGPARAGTFLVRAFLPAASEEGGEST